MDLNNFATFPTLAVGILVASLREAGHLVTVLCPLNHDVPAAEREHPEGTVDQLMRRLHHTTFAPLIGLRDAGRRARAWWMARPHPAVLRETRRALAAGPDIVLLSAYLQHYPSVVEIGRLASERGVPLVLGGPMFNIPETAEAWRSVPGLTAIVGGEVDRSLPRIVAAACDGGDLLQFGGVVLPDGRRSAPAVPLRGLDRAPTPDFSDFPWERYRFRVVPMMTGRGCQWARCTFCSDVVSASGRTFRTRGLDSVLGELRQQAERCGTKNFLFLDLKLNSNPALFRGLVARIQDEVPGAEWIGTVHVDLRRDNGLDAGDLEAAAAAGMRRISFGLESGSQRLLDAMDKGSSVERNSAFVRAAHRAGLSVRCTLFKGYPGETGADLQSTADFLERHSESIDRVRYNDLSIPAGTPIAAALSGNPGALPGLRLKDWDHRNARASYGNPGVRTRAYARANGRVISAVHAINRRLVRQSALAFDGLM